MEKPDPPTGFIARTPGNVQISGHLWDHAQLLAITVASALGAPDAAECQRRLQLARQPAHLLATSLPVACEGPCGPPEKAPAPVKYDPTDHDGYEARFSD